MLRFQRRLRLADVGALLVGRYRACDSFQVRTRVEPPHFLGSEPIRGVLISENPIADLHHAEENEECHVGNSEQPVPEPDHAFRVNLDEVPNSERYMANYNGGQPRVIQAFESTIIGDTVS